MASIAVPAELAIELPADERVASTFIADYPIAFVIPAYNEAENVPRLFADLESNGWLFGNAGTRVFIVDDGSSDETPDLVGGYSGALPVELVRLEQNQGPGAAFRTGFGRALEALPEEGFVVTLEADTTSDLAALRPMLAEASAGAELVLASWTMVNVSRRRQVLSAGAAYVFRRALGIEAHTVSSFFRVYRASVLRALVRALRRGPDARAWLRLQGRAAREHRAFGGEDRRGSGRPRQRSPGRQEQDAGLQDHRRLLPHARPSAARARGRAGGGDRVSRPSVGIVGGGILGMTAAYRLAKAGVHVALFERASDLGGLVGSFDFAGRKVDRFYHVILPSDDRVIGLAEELGLGDRFRFRPTKVGFFDGGRLFSMTSPKEFLTFPILRPWERARLAAFVARCQLKSTYDDLDQVSLEDWLRRLCGRRVVDKLWRPLLDSKFDGRYDDLPATYIWARSRRCRRRVTPPAARSWVGWRAAADADRRARGAHSLAQRQGARLHLRRADRRNGPIRRTGSWSRTLPSVRLRALHPRASDGTASSVAGSPSARRPTTAATSAWSARCCASSQRRRTTAWTSRTGGSTDHRGRDHARRRPGSRRRSSGLCVEVRRPVAPGPRPPSEEIEADYRRHVKTIFPVSATTSAWAPRPAGAHGRAVHLVGGAVRLPSSSPPGLALASTATSTRRSSSGRP